MLKNPVVVVNGKLIRAENYKEGDAFCPACKNKLILRKCIDKINHFAHIGDRSCSPGEIHAASESIMHKEAKAWLCDNKPNLQHRCDSCKTPMIIETPKNTGWNQEVSKSKYIIDVLVGNFAIEVVHTHKCSYDKIIGLEDLGLRWYEVSSDNPVNVLRGCRTLCSRCQRLVINHKKHKGKTILEIYRCDKPYAEWMFLSCTGLGQEIVSILSQLLRRSISQRNDMLFMLSKIEANRHGPDELIKERNTLLPIVISKLGPMKSGIIDITRYDKPNFTKLNGESVYVCEDRKKRLNYLDWCIAHLEKIDPIKRFFILDAKLELMEPCTHVIANPTVNFSYQI